MREMSPIAVLLVFGGLANSGSAAPAAAVFRSFDGPELTWQLGDERPGASVLAHGCVGDDARQGTGSERLVIAAPGGEAMHFLCAIGRVPVLDEVEARLWVKASRPGVVLSARVVLPRSVHSKTGLPRTALVSGDQSRLPDRWQQLRLADVPGLLAAQARVMRATHGCSIDTREAYVDAIVLAVPGGPPRTAVWTDGLEIDGIVVQAVAETTSGGEVAPAVAAIPDWQNQARVAPTLAGAQLLEIRFQGTTLLVGGKPFLSLGIEWNSEPFAFLAARGFNTVWLNSPPTPEQTAEAVRANLWLTCKPPRPDELDESGLDGGLGDSFERVLAWNLGNPAGPPELEYFRRWAGMVRERDPVTSRPIVIAPRGDWLPASRFSDVLLADHPTSSRLSAKDFATWLAGLPQLTGPGTPLWVRVPTQPGPKARQQVAALLPGTQLPRTALDESQLESLVIAAATNGCRGFLFESDSPLDAADDATKRRAVLVEMLNCQLEMLRPWLTIGKRVGEATAADASATASLLQAERARLLIPASWDAADGSSTSAKKTSGKSVTYVVPGVPESNQAYRVTPAELESLPSKRVAGGTQITFDRDEGAWVLITEDPQVISGFRRQTASGGRSAAQLQYSLAMLRARALAGSSRRLAALGVDCKILDQSVAAANAELSKANSLLAAGKFEDAFRRSASARQFLAEARAALRGEGLETPAFESVPFGDDEESLVQQFAFESSLAPLRSSDNQLPGGDFEDLGRLRQLGWQHIDDPMEGIATQVKLSGQGAKEGRYCLELSAQAGHSGATPLMVPRPRVWITSPPVRAEAGEVLEISGWVRVTQSITGSIEGLEIIDSLGGPELALRVRATNDWQPFRMIRGTAETTEMTLSFALQGIGSACVDGVMVRSLAAPSVKRLPTVMNEPGPSFPSSARRSLFGPPQQH